MKEGDEWCAAAVAVQSAWAEAFEERDLDRLAGMYADETAFYGSTADFYETPAGVRSYFERLPASYSRAEYGAPHIVRLGRNSMAATGEVTFFTQSEGVEFPRSYRMTHVFVRQNGAWKIATHHASPRP